MTNKIEFTKEANEQILKILSEQDGNSYFRISVHGGGCSGFKYNYSFDGKIEKDKPHPQEEVAFGFTITNESPIISFL